MQKVITFFTLVVFGFSTFSSAALAAEIQEDSGISIQNEGTYEVLEGTDENWSKLKVVDGSGLTEFIEKEIVDGLVTFNVFTEDNILTHTVVSDGEGEIQVDGKQLEKISEKVIIKKFDVGIMANDDVGTGFYLISEIKSSYSSDWDSLALAISVLSTMFFKIPGGLASALATSIIGAKIPLVWYHERKYSDNLAYHPTTKIYVTHYADPRMTQYIGYTDYVY